MPLFAATFILKGYGLHKTKGKILILFKCGANFPLSWLARILLIIFRFISIYLFYWASQSYIGSRITPKLVYGRIRTYRDVKFKKNTTFENPSLTQIFCESLSFEQRVRLVFVHVCLQRRLEEGFPKHVSSPLYH